MLMIIKTRNEFLENELDIKSVSSLIDFYEYSIENMIYKRIFDSFERVNEYSFHVIDLYACLYHTARILSKLDIDTKLVEDLYHDGPKGFIRYFYKEELSNTKVINLSPMNNEYINIYLYEDFLTKSVLPVRNYPYKILLITININIESTPKEEDVYIIGGKIVSILSNRIIKDNASINGKFNKYDLYNCLMSRLSNVKSIHSSHIIAICEELFDKIATNKSVEANYKDAYIYIQNL